IIPPAQIIAGATAGLPPIDSAGLGNAERVAMVARGRYIYSVASCALCHNANGAGGLKVSWKPMGTLWARNITPDAETGIGKWSDKEIARAIRSGVSRDGYQLHWQGMIWDHAGNWDEEDLRVPRAGLPLGHGLPARDRVGGTLRGCRFHRWPHQPARRHYPGCDSLPAQWLGFPGGGSVLATSCLTFTGRSVLGWHGRADRRNRRRTPVSRARHRENVGCCADDGGVCGGHSGRGLTPARRTAGAACARGNRPGHRLDHPSQPANSATS